MKITSFEKLNMYKKAELYFASFCLIYLSSGFGVGVRGGYVLLMYFLCLFSFVYLRNFKNASKINIPALFCLLLAVISFIYNGEDMKQILILISYFLTAMVFCSAYDYEKWFGAYVKIMYVISVCSIILYVLDILIPSFSSYLPTVTNSMYLKKGTILFAVTPTKNRNYGCFWEPGAFQTYLVLAFIIETFIYQSKYKKRITSLLIALVTTFSTAGYASMLTAITALLVSGITDKSMSKSTRNTIIIVLLAAITAFCIIKYLYPQLYGTLFGKVEKYNVEQNDNSSTGVRLNSITKVFSVFFEHPIFGVGKTKLKDIFRLTYGHAMTTCTYANWFAYFGALFGCIMIAGLYKFTELFSKKKLIRIILFLTIISSITSENYVMNPTILMLVFYGFTPTPKTIDILDTEARCYKYTGDKFM